MKQSILVLFSERNLDQKIWGSVTQFAVPKGRPLRIKSTGLSVM